MNSCEKGLLASGEYSFSLIFLLSNLQSAQKTLKNQKNQKYNAKYYRQYYNKCRKMLHNTTPVRNTKSAMDLLE